MTSAEARRIRQSLGRSQSDTCLGIEETSQSLLDSTRDLDSVPNVCLTDNAKKQLEFESLLLILDFFSLHRTRSDE